MPAILNNSLLTSRSGRVIGVATLLVVILLFLWNHSDSVSSPNGGSAPRLRSVAESEYLENAKVTLNTTQWGEMGHRMKLLSAWAEQTVKNADEDPRHFEAALLEQFPFLVGTEETVYRPWLKRPASTHTSSVGFVICTGSNNFRLAAHLISSLRTVYKVDTPIEIAYSGDADLKPQHRTFLQELADGVTFIDLLQYFPHAHHELIGSGWAMKPFSLLASSHSRAILIDADALFLQSPADIFETNPGLARTGTLFFHDRAAVGGDDERLNFVKAQIQAAGKAPSRYLQTESLFYSGAAWYEADSGLVAIDKSRSNVLIGLIWATWMNTKEVREQVSYRIFYGDKETFWVAMELSDVDYYFQPWYAGTMGTIEADGTAKTGIDLSSQAYEICGTHMLHLDHKGEMPFWINGGIYEHKEDTTSGYMKMTHYWVGATQAIRDSQPQWYWRNGNTGCLREKNIKIIPQAILNNIDKVIVEGKRVDEITRGL